MAMMDTNCPLCKIYMVNIIQALSDTLITRLHAPVGKWGKATMPIVLGGLCQALWAC